MFKFVVALLFVTLSGVLCAPTQAHDSTSAPPGETHTNTTMLEKRVTHVGRATWFHAGLGNCGSWDNDDSPIVAVSTAMYKEGGNCNQWVQLTNTANGKSVYAKMRDSCPPCGYNDVDLSPKAFKALAPLSQGVFTVSWHFMNRNFSP